MRYSVAFLRRWCWPLVLAPLLAAGCASVSGWDTESAGPDFPDGLIILGEVIMVTSREEALSGNGLMKGWRDKMISAGYTDEDIVDGSEVTVWAYCYGHNSGVPLCAHHGHYVAHVPSNLRSGLQGDPDSNSESSGDLVEVELSRIPNGALVGKVVAVYRKSQDWSPCRDAYLERGDASSGLMTAMGVGPPRANWIECDAVAENDGWTRRAIPGAPVSNGPPVSVWVKLPE